VHFGVPRVNRGETGKMRVDTPEHWHTLCLIFDRETNVFFITSKQFAVSWYRGHGYGLKIQGSARVQTRGLPATFEPDYKKYTLNV